MNCTDKSCYRFWNYRELKCYYRSGRRFFIFSILKEQCLQIFYINNLHLVPCFCCCQELHFRHYFLYINYFYQRSMKKITEISWHCCFIVYVYTGAIPVQVANNQLTFQLGSGYYFNIYAEIIPGLVNANPFSRWVCSIYCNISRLVC